MNVGIDIDNTINMLDESIAYYLDQESGMDTLPILRKHYYIEDAIGWSKERMGDFFLRNGYNISQYAGIKPMAREMIEGLKRRHMNLFVLTNRSRDWMGKDIEIYTSLWLNKHGILEHLTHMGFVKGSKYDYCQEKGIRLDVMVEDHASRALEFAENGVPVLLFDYEYNRHVSHPNIKRVTNWWEVFQEIVKLQDSLKGV